MFCPKCGSELPGNIKFCPNCGQEQQKHSGVGGNKGSRWVSPEPETPTVSPEEQARKGKMVRGVLAGVAALLVIIVLMIAFIKPSIDLNRYLQVSFEGYDTVGKGVVTFDYEKFAKENEKRLNKSKDTKLSFFGNRDSGYYESAASNAFLKECVSWSLSAEDHLKNDDVVTLTWDCNDDYALEKYGFRLKHKEKDYTVTGLAQATTFDPFEGCEMVFEGISPNGEAYIAGEPVNPEAKNLCFALDRRYDLSNGDQVTVTVSSYYGEDIIEYCIENYGKIPSPTERTYAVEGLDSYVKSLDEVSEESLTQMKTQAQDVYTSYVAKDWGEGEKLESLSYLGNYLLTAKDNGSSNKNYLYLVYKAKIKNQYSNGEENYDKTNEVYWYISYRNLLVNPEGETTVDVTSYWTPNERYTVDSGVSSGWYGTRSWYYNGYGSLSELYKAVVESNVEYYNHEDQVPDESSAQGEEVNIEMPEPETETGVVFVNSSEKVLSEEEIENLSDENLRYAINEIYARHGYIFKDEELRAYYEKFDWYEGTVESDDFSIDMFNEVEMKNVELLQAERDSRN